MRPCKLSGDTTFLGVMGDASLGRLSDGAVERALAGPPTLAAILLLVLNDHLLKGAGILPGVLTGKLSDFAFLFFGPIVVAYVMRACSRWAVAVAFAIPTAVFVAINVSTIASDLFARTLGAVVPSAHVCDAEDLVALVMLPFSWGYLWRRARTGRATSRPRPLSQVLVVIVASLGCVATSKQPDPPPMVPTHRAVYMSWDELRTTAVQVKEPHAVGKRGKLLIADGHLFLSEPSKGVHIFDNIDPKSPKALMFIQIPGYFDIAVRDGRLYADSFVDLLVFELDLPNRTARLVERLEDQFEYDPYQALTTDTPLLVEGLDRTRGVVVQLVPFDPSAQVAQ